MARNLVISVLLQALTLPSSTASTVQLPDGTPVPVRLAGVIDSERSTTGEQVAFVVMKDIVAGSVLLIKQGTPVVGVVVKARPAHRGFVDHEARLAFKFNQTTAGDGQAIRLRASPARSTDDRVVVDRYGHHHDMRWAGEGDTFNAYVDGDYEILAR